MSLLVLYNTLSRSKEKLEPLNDKKINMFVCGQTVYDDAHLGHARNYVSFDIIARWLRQRGYNLKYIQNITDIDDKIIARAAENNTTPELLARRYEERFMEDMSAIGVKENVDLYPRSHDYIKEMRTQIQLLIDKGYAYLSEGNIYFEIDKFPDYTKLSGMKIDELSKHRIEFEPGKRKPYDFTLWKKAKSGEPHWPEEFILEDKPIIVDGRPGWHIEDTAITNAIFGPQYDIHGGASELIFPHHSNEIAQDEAAFGKKPMVKYWVHSGVLRIKGEKMSKSLKNFITIREVLKKYDPEALRLMVAFSHYRSQIDFSEDLLKKASTSLNYLYSSLSMIYNAKESESAARETEKIINEISSSLENEFSTAMDNDFETPQAIASLFNAISSLRTVVEKNTHVDGDSKKKAINTLLNCASVIGILKHDWYKEPLSEEAISMIRERDRLRREKSFDEADRIRTELKNNYNINIEDTEYGTVWYREQNSQGRR
jgi:cysteinyl-tRNA synthetase